ncbi:MAG TPA: hypothetical protein P5079_11455, partial [Elusimicrobiota bacterium]|nr:hypothetical protein [Elusimicrobiota bacterium]
PRIGRSKIRPVRDSLRTFQFLVEIIVYFNPLKAVMPLIVALFLGALLCGTAYVYLKNDSLLISSVLFFSASCVVFAVGMLMNQLRLTRNSQNKNPC